MSSSTQQTHNYVQLLSPVGADGIVRCHHNEPVTRLTSKSEANPGREFYTCIKSRDDPEKCKFFKWADELQGYAATPRTHVVPAPRSPSKRPRDGEATPSTLNVSPSKASMTAALSRSSPMTVVDNDNEIVDLQSDEEISQFLEGTPSSERPVKKKFKFQKSESPTSPGFSSTSASPSKPTPLIGETTSKTPTQNQWKTIQNDPENPFHARAVALRSPAGTRSLAEDTVTPESITRALDSLLAVPELIEKLQRKLIATEKSRDKKAERIVELQNEIQSLKDQKRLLEETVEALRARR